MTADGPNAGNNSGGCDGHMAGFRAGGALLGFVVAGVASLMGVGRVPAVGLGFLAFGLALWIGGMRPDPALMAVDERTRRQRQRSLMIGLGLGALVVIFYVATLVRLGPNVVRKDGTGGVSPKNVIVEDEAKKRAGEAACKKAGTC